MHTPPLVVVGASAGGIEALLELVARLPTGMPAAVLVVVHTAERPDTALPRILERAGPLAAISPPTGLHCSVGTSSSPGPAGT